MTMLQKVLTVYSNQFECST